MRPSSPIRYATSRRSPARLRATSHAPTFKAKPASQPVADVHTLTTAEPVITQQSSAKEHAA
ncbi:hypothetical protein C942_04075 [Photobacterium marinum]|uniref:Uncharacterized protein n=1 Tax=Photobacterium marinum TaxID=1056511 RepID=L8J4I7_9GAMM|nr:MULTISPECIES: hypothetical protein [Photobacterium]ELR63133.1 hypothetical protein C942_04075 [Photobacterium marinum]